MSQEFVNKVAVVTGASGGIGSACSRMLAARGASVILIDLQDCSDQAATLQKELRVDCVAISLDVTSPDSVRDAFRKVQEWNGRLDFCVNAAGIFPAGQLVENESTTSWATVLAVNLSGTFYCLQQEIRIFRQLNTSGSIVNISSDAGSVASIGCAAYVASKHGLNGLTKTAAIENAKNGIRINAVAPGNVETPMIAQYGSYADIAKSTQPTGRCGKPEEIAELVCFLLSDRATFMTGAVVAIDGGITTTGFSGYNDGTYTK